MTSPLFGFGGPASFGPLGNAGPSNAAANSTFSFASGEVAWGAPSQAQSIINNGTIVLVVGVVVAALVLTRGKRR